MNIEQPAFCIIHNYRKHNAAPVAQQEGESEQLESMTPVTPISTEGTNKSDSNNEHPEG